MKKIQLTQGKHALVDDDDYEYLSQWKWTMGNKYAIRMSPRPNRKMIFMHRVINKTPDGLYTDHINRDGLDNRKGNLRTCTTEENSRNQISAKNKSGYIGVSWFKETRKWVAQCRHNGKKVYLGLHDDIDEAVKARDRFVNENYGEFGILNKPISK